MRTAYVIGGVALAGVAAYLYHRNVQKQLASLKDGGQKRLEGMTFKPLSGQSNQQVVGASATFINELEKRIASEVTLIREQPRFDEIGADVAAITVGADVLDNLAKKSPAFKSYLERKAAANATVIRKQPRLQAQDWQVDFGPVPGYAGTIITVSVQPQCIFRCEKIFATDDYGNYLDTPQPNLNGRGTRVGQILIGQRNQRPATTFTLSSFFSITSLGNGVKLNTCKEALTISAQVSFIQTCTFDMTMFGKAIP
jgi:hypothetical protein